MYRHEALEIARKMMELHGVTDELKPWVIDVVLKVANSVVWELPLAPDAPRTRTPVVYRAVFCNGSIEFADSIEMKIRQKDCYGNTIDWQPLYAD